MRGWERPRRVAWWVSCVLIAIGIVAAGPAGAQTPQQLNWCSGGKDSPSPEQKIAACTAVIQSGRYSGKSLALVFNNRANGYLKKGDRRPRHRRLRPGAQARSQLCAGLQQSRQGLFSQEELRPRHRRLTTRRSGSIRCRASSPTIAAEPAPTSTTTAATSISPRRTMPAPSPTTTAPSRSIPRTP